ncbi:MAG TPA: hypothetical protein VE573_10110 [Nitrososphaeraceae archaeon]|nr:hypothetical protein [Nitrososphaeraceae archaeon]
MKFTKPQLIAQYTLSEEQTGNHLKQEVACEDDQDAPASLCDSYRRVIPPPPTLSI